MYGAQGGMNYDMLARQKQTTQPGVEMMQNNQTMANIQVNKLRQLYPETMLFKQSQMDTQHRVPLKLAISPVPLYVKVTLSNQFPQVPPKVHMMSSVTHNSLHPATIEYIGPALANWNPQSSSLANVIKAIHQEFEQQPPMPKQQSMAGLAVLGHIQNAQMRMQQQQPGQAMPQQQQEQPVEFQEKQRYCGEQVALEKPQLKELRQRVMNSMDQDEVNRYSGQLNERKTLYFEQPEVQELQGKVKKLVGELKMQVDENNDERKQLQAIWDQYDQKFQMHESLEMQNQTLQAQALSLGGNAGANSKQNVVGLLNQKASEQDGEARGAEKSFLRREIDMRAFLDQYVKKRQDYHKYQILKVKVGQQ